MNSLVNNKNDEDDALPGFRFHPTDEELLGFYLRRKVEKKPISTELIKHVDIYKYDPWDLQKISTVGDQELYFFCMRGRKYRNSVRPNRVTGSGFWKATGIDKPICSGAGNNDCIGLKKSLVYYRGSAGKGTKTDWMLHEYRLPPTGKTCNLSPKNIAQEAEVWTLCRIFKRIPSSKKYIPYIKQESIKQNQMDSSSKSSSIESEISEQYMSHAESSIQHYEKNHIFDEDLNSIAQTPLSPSVHSSFWSGNNEDEDFFRYGNWDDLRSIVAHVSDYR